MRGELDFTVMRMNDDNGVAMAEAIRLDIENNTHKVPTIYSGDFASIEKGISEAELADLKAKAFRYSGTDWRLMEPVIRKHKQTVIQPDY